VSRIEAPATVVATSPGRPTSTLETGPSRVRFSKVLRKAVCVGPKSPQRLRWGSLMGSVDRWPMAIAIKPDIRGHAEANIRPWVRDWWLVTSSWGSHVAVHWSPSQVHGVLCSGPLPGEISGGNWITRRSLHRASLAPDDSYGEGFGYSILRLEKPNSCAFTERQGAFPGRA
jgi:hypothetical protein